MAYLAFPIIMHKVFIVVKPCDGRIETESGELLSKFSLKTEVLLDEAKVGGCIPLIIGCSLTERARETLGLGATDVFRRPVDPQDSGKGFTLAQKMVDKACGVDGIRPGTYCEPRMSTVGCCMTNIGHFRYQLKNALQRWRHTHHLQTAGFHR